LPGVVVEEVIIVVVEGREETVVITDVDGNDVEGATVGATVGACTLVVGTGGSPMASTQ
jgi:hypothetical protein